MEVIKSWALSVTAAAAITAVISFLSPSGSLDKSVKTITALFMLVCFIVPFFKADVIEIVTDDVDKLSEWLAESKLKKEVEEDVVTMLESSAQARVSAYLKNKGAEKSEVDIKIKIDENHNIDIENIRITLFEKTDIKALEDFVKSEFGLLPEITVNSEG